MTPFGAEKITRYLLMAYNLAARFWYLKICWSLFKYIYISSADFLSYKSIIKLISTIPRQLSVSSHN